MARTLLLVRHAAVAPELSGRYIGRTDVTLSPEGRRQAAVLSERVAVRKPQRCFCSPLRRAKETAGPIGAGTGLNVQEDDALREVDFGRWEGRTFQEIAAADPDVVTRWAEFAEDFAFPGGESLREFFFRVQRVADRLSADPADTVLAVTHGGVIRAILCHLLGLPPRNYVLFDIRCASVATVALFGTRGVLRGLEEPAS